MFVDVYLRTNDRHARRTKTNRPFGYLIFRTSFYYAREYRSYAIQPCIVQRFWFGERTPREFVVSATAYSTIKGKSAGSYFHYRKSRRGIRISRGPRSFRPTCRVRLYQRRRTVRNVTYRRPVDNRNAFVGQKLAAVDVACSADSLNRKSARFDRTRNDVEVRVLS